MSTSLTVFAELLYHDVIVLIGRGLPVPAVYAHAVSVFLLDSAAFM